MLHIIYNIIYIYMHTMLLRYTYMTFKVPVATGLEVDEWPLGGIPWTNPIKVPLNAIESPLNAIKYH